MSDKEHLATHPSQFTLAEGQETNAEEISKTYMPAAYDTPCNTMKHLAAANKAHLDGSNTSAGHK